jgi:hypothetical protein
MGIQTPADRALERRAIRRLALPNRRCGTCRAVRITTDSTPPSAFSHNFALGALPTLRPWAVFAPAERRRLTAPERDMPTKSLMRLLRAAMAPQVRAASRTAESSRRIQLINRQAEWATLVEFGLPMTDQLPDEHSPVCRARALSAAENGFGVVTAKLPSLSPPSAAVLRVPRADDHRPTHQSRLHERTRLPPV